MTQHQSNKELVTSEEITTYSISIEHFSFSFFYIFISFHSSIKILIDLKDYSFLDWLLPSVCEIHEKIQIVYEQLTCNWVK